MTGHPERADACERCGGSLGAMYHVIYGAQGVTYLCRECARTIAPEERQPTRQEG
jgi:ribosomal protein S14